MLAFLGEKPDMLGVATLEIHFVRELSARVSVPLVGSRLERSNSGTSGSHDPGIVDKAALHRRTTHGRISSPLHVRKREGTEFYLFLLHSSQAHYVRQL